jgi:hypothetical protein
MRGPTVQMPARIVKLIDSCRSFKNASIARSELFSARNPACERSQIRSSGINQDVLRKRSSKANSGTANAAVTSESSSRRNVNIGAAWFNSTRCVIARITW